MTAESARRGAVPDPRADGRFAVLSSEQHFHGRIVSVRVDTVTMPGGGSARREIVDHMRAVAVVAVDEVGRAVLIAQYRHPLRRRLWEVPAGLMDVAGEGPLECAQRELREEVGLIAERWSVLVDLTPSPGYSTEAVRVFLAQRLTTAQSDRAPGGGAGGAARAHNAADEEADLRVIRLPLGAAVRAVFDGRIVNAAAVAGLLAADRALRGRGNARAGDDATVTAGDGEFVLRPGDDPWADSPALIADILPGRGIGDAPDLAPAPNAVTPDARVGR